MFAAPNNISILKATSATESSITLEFNQTDSGPTVSYRIFRNDSLIETFNEVNYTADCQGAADCSYTDNAAGTQLNPSFCLSHSVQVVLFCFRSSAGHRL